jgi:NAD+ synthase
MDMPRLDTNQIALKLEAFLYDRLKLSGLEGYVAGLSGGIDSALSVSIAANAVGPEKVRGIIMPYSSSSKDSVEDALQLTERLGMASEIIEISPMIDAYYKNTSSVDKIRTGNKMARERMAILFDKAAQHRSMVLGTSNRTEICLGYGTWYGDVACSLNPLGHLYKTQVRIMAEHYGVPGRITSKIPTADLWPGQTDEDELGLEYEKVDKLLYVMIDLGENKRKTLNGLGFQDDFIDRAISLLNRNYFKRRLPEIADLGLKPIPDRLEIV